MVEEIKPVLDVRDLRVVLRRGGEGVPLVDGVSFSLFPGRMLALVGESGCGKSMTALSLLDLLPKPQVDVESGSVMLEGEDLRSASKERLRQVRGHDIAMVFQEPTTSLNPVLTIGVQMVEAIQAHGAVDAQSAQARALALLERVRLPDPMRVFNAYPHRLSGGMCQRVMIAMALTGHPKVLIADEPTTALDVTVQAQILELIADLQREEQMAVLLITHDLGLVAGYADDVAVMYAGRIVEGSSVERVFQRPMHPYTDDLLQAAPHFSDAPDAGRERFREIRGQVPAPGKLPPGCSFAPRCSRAQPQCDREKPVLQWLPDEHRLACHRQGVFA